MITSNQYLKLDTTESVKKNIQPKHSRNSTLNKSKFQEDNPDSLMKKMLSKNKHLVSIDVEESERREQERKSCQKKDIVSYTANRDTLFIPHPERPKRPVDIRTNLIEEADKRQVADVGMQSDVINYENKEKPFIPHKIGKDIGVQIEDGDLFNFDKDVEPLLTVLCGKILEQTDLELSQEAELKNLRETKASFVRKFRIQKDEIKKLEEEEIKKKKESDDRRKRKRLEKATKIDTQQKLVSRTFGKFYLQNILSNTLKELDKSFIFRDFKQNFIKDEINHHIMATSEQTLIMNEKLHQSLIKVKDELLNKNLKTHGNTVIQHKQFTQMVKDEALKKRIEEEKQKKKEEEERKERRRQRKIKRIRESIRKQIFEVPVVKGEYQMEEISEIDNYELEGPFIGIYGGLIGSFVISLSLVKKNFFPQDQFYTSDMIIEMLTCYLSECGNFNIYFNNTIEETMRTILDKPDLELNGLKGNTNLVSEDWIKIGEVLSDINLNHDYILKDLLLNKLRDKISKDFYPLLIKSLCSMIEKGNSIDKINFVFKNPSEKENFEDRITPYQAFCKYTLNENCSDILESADFIKDSKKKKSVKAPEFDNEYKTSKYFQRTPEHNVLIYDKNAELIIRNKILENCLKIINTETDTKTIFKGFNEMYETIISSSNIYDMIQLYEYSHMELNQVRENLNI